jgi:hypothetical protein
MYILNIAEEKNKNPLVSQKEQNCEIPILLSMGYTVFLS